LRVDLGPRADPVCALICLPDAGNDVSLRIVFIGLLEVWHKAGVGRRRSGDLST
jgi:hypothetical protein